MVIRQSVNSTSLSPGHAPLTHPPPVHLPRSYTNYIGEKKRANKDAKGGERALSLKG